MERAGGTSDSRPVSDGVPLEVLEHRLMSRAAELAASEAEWMTWLAEYDERRGWAEWGCIGPAHWLSWKCGMSPSAARERVRVATALTTLPEIQAEYGKGRLSYSKVQALTRVANEFNETDLVEMAANATGAQLSRICAGYRNSAATSDDAAEMAFASRRLASRRHHDGSTSITLRIPDADAALVSEHLERIVTELIDEALGDPGADSPQAAQTRRDVIANRGGIAALRADAATALLTGQDLKTEPTPAEVAMIVDESDVHECEDACAQVSEEPTVLVGADATARPVGRRLLCDPRVHALIESAEAGPLAVGRTTRIIGRRLRRALQRRDNGCCQFPGCYATRRLHAHHIVHWVDGGPTDLDNLILVCHFHHHLVHEGKWSIEPGTHRFLRPDGAPVDPTPEHLRAGVGPIEPTSWQGATVGPLEPPNMSPFDLPWATTVLHHNEAIRRRELDLRSD